MNGGVISTRYARALFGFAKARGAEERVYNEMVELGTNWLANPGMTVALDNPMIKRESKLQLIHSAAGGSENISEELKRFVVLLLDKKRAEYLIFISYSYQDLYLKSRNIEKIELTTALEIDKQLEERIVRMLEDKTKATIWLNSRVDRDIIGGFMVRWDTYRINATVAGEFKRLERSWIGKK